MTQARSASFPHKRRQPGRTFLRLLAATWFHPAIVATTLAGFLLALVLSASPELHERLHHDADDEHGHHECLATVLHAGGCDDAAPAPPLAGATIPVTDIPLPDRSRSTPSLYLSFRILEHAPPRRA